MQSNEEIWKDIPNFAGLYQVSSLGRFKSLDRFVQNKPSIFHFIKGRLLNEGNNKGYKNICLSKNGKYLTRPSHRIIAQTFIPNPESKRTVNHKNGIKTDNRLENLEWTTYSENNSHAFRTGLKVGVHGIKSHFSKLQESDVLEIREAIGNQNVIAKQYGITQSIVSMIKAKKIWKYL